MSHQMEYSMEYLIVKECHAQLDYFKQRRHSRTVVLSIFSIYPNLIVQKLMIFLRRQFSFLELCVHCCQGFSQCCLELIQVLWLWQCLCNISSLFFCWLLHWKFRAVSRLSSTICCWTCHWTPLNLGQPCLWASPIRSPVLLLCTVAQGTMIFNFRH